MYLKQVINNTKWETIIFHTSLNDAQLLLNRILIELTATLNRLVLKKYFNCFNTQNNLVFPETMLYL